MDYKSAVTDLNRVLEGFFAARKDVWRQMIEAVASALTGCRKVLVFGNGGSAAEAQHFAAELVNRFMHDRRPIPAMALTTDTSCLTAIGNDADFGQVFSRQVEAHGEKGDIAIALTTSGESANVIAALRAARVKGMITVAFTGEGGIREAKTGPATKSGAAGVVDSAKDAGLAAGAKMEAPASLVDYLLAVPSSSTARTQEAHLVLLHLLAEEIENRLG